MCAILRKFFEAPQCLLVFLGVVLVTLENDEVRCDIEDCLFYETNFCKDCRECAYCGKYLYWSGDRRNIHFEHIRAYVSGGRTVVPVCDDCNLSKGKKGLKEWLRWLRESRPHKWEATIDYNLWKRHKIGQVVREIRDEL
jgi:hypothetical protein